MRTGLVGAIALLVSAASMPSAEAQTPPPAPVLVAPANGAALVQPIGLQWAPVVDPDGPIGSYTWQVSTTSTFGSVIASGSNNFDGDVPLPTRASLSGLANGSYFWRVKAAQDQGAAGFFDSPWSATGNFSITGLGPAPGTPTITAPTQTSFHPYEFFDIVWSAAPGAHYYLLEADDDAGFSHPITLSGGPQKVFGTKFHAGWGNEIPNVFYRVRAVSADNVWGRPSATLTVHITNAAPVAAAPTPVSPASGATIQLPFVFDWTDTTFPNGYDVDIDDEPNFLGTVGVLLVTGITRSDYMVVQDPLVEHINRIPPGNYFWRVRAVHGSVTGPWSAGKAFTVAASPATPPGFELFWILTDPGSVQAGNSTAARIALNMPAPAGGAVVKVASDLPGVEVPTGTVTIPAGSTDAVVAPVTTSLVSGATLGTLRAAYGLSWQQNSIGEWQSLWGADLAAERVVGGSTVTGTVTLLGPAPAGGMEVRLLSSDTSLARPPASVVIPAGETGASFSVTTSPVSQPTRIVLECGTPSEGYQAPGTWLVLLPSGSPAPPPALSTLTLSPPAVPGDGAGTGTVTLTAPAPAGGMLIKISGSMEGDVVVPIPSEITVPAGSLSASFPITPPPVARSHWVLIQASEWPLGMLHARTLRVDPGPPGLSDPWAIDVRPNQLIGGETARGTVGLRVPAPPGGEVVSLVSSDSSVAQVPASVTVAAGNSTASFDVTTSSVVTGASASVTGTAKGVSKTAWIYTGPDPNAPLQLLSITPSVSGTTGGNPINTTLFMNKAAPAGGAVVPLSSSNPAAAQVPASVTVPAGLGFASFNITTSPVTVDTPVTITGTFGLTQTTTITVLAPPPAPPGFNSPTANAADTGGDGNGFETTPSNAQGDDAANAVDNNSGTGTGTSCTSSGKDRHRFYNYGFSVPSGVTINGIEVRLDARADSTANAPMMCVQLSWDGGVTWTAAKATGTLGTSMATFTLGSQTDTWGRAWSAGELGNASFRARVIDVSSSTSRDFFLDWIAVRVTTSTPASDTTPPTVSITSPTAGSTVSGTVAISAMASDNVGVTKVDFLVDGALLSSDTTSPYSATWNTTTAANGSHTLTAKAFDAANNQTTSAPVGVTVNNAPPPPDTTPPTVSITSPAAGATVSGTITISATASDNVGVTKVDFLVDGALLSTDTTAPYSAPWNTTTATNGSHTLSARAFDAANNQTTSAPVGVTVSNTAAPTLTVTATGRGGERVSSSPAGIDVAVGQTQSASFAAGTSITLSATNGRDVIWSGICSSNGQKARTCTFTLNANASETANVQ